MSEHTGGCLCGAVRYRFDHHVDAGFCHCRLCQRASGAPVMAFANVPADAFVLEAGAASEYAATERGSRGRAGFAPTDLVDEDGELYLRLPLR